MAHLSVVSTKPLAARKWIPFAVKQRIWAKPCAVCGIPYDIKVDHIVPVSCGGDNEESNLQPLCHGCNHMKHNRLTNRDVARKVALLGVDHFIAAAYRLANRYRNPYDGYGMERFKAEQPDQIKHAQALHAAFIDRFIK